jgi:hypothetical protein
MSDASREELVSQIIEALGPAPGVSKADVEGRLQDIKLEFFALTGIAPPRAPAGLTGLSPPPREIRDAHLRVAKAVERLEQLYQNFPGVRITTRSQEVNPQDLPGDCVTEVDCALLLREARRRRAAAARIVVPRAPRVSAKRLCAKRALMLMQEFSDARPTATNGGTYRTVATLLWGLLMGEPDADLDKHCRHALRHQ